MNSILNLTRLTTFLLLVVSLTNVSASVVYQYTGNNFNSFSSPSSYDSSMMVTITLELPSEIYTPFVSRYVFPSYFRFEDGNQVIDNTNATRSGFLFETDYNGDIVSWEVFATIETEFKAIHSIKFFWYDVTGNDYGGAPLEGSAYVYDTPGTWTVVPLPPAFYLFGSGLLCIISIAKKDIHSRLFSRTGQRKHSI